MIHLLRYVWNSGRPTADELARQIVEQSVVATRRRMRSDTTIMSAAELRGYVRARATRPVREIVERIAAEHGVQKWFGETEIARALEMTVYKIAHAISAQPAVATAACRATLRVAG